MFWFCVQAEEMEQAVGDDKVKEALGAMGLKQGGTNVHRRDRLWSTRGKLRTRLLPLLQEIYGEGVGQGVACVQS